MRLLRRIGIAVLGVLALLAVGFGVVFFQTQSRIQRVYEVDPESVQGSLALASEAGWIGEVDRAAPPDGEGAEETLGDGFETGGNGNPMERVLAWGEHIAVTRGCIDCHGEDMGGALFADGMPVFRLHGSNLTSAGVGASYSDQDWVRAIRHGIGPDGKPLLFMPSYEYYYLSDADLAALIAYLKSLPAIQRELGDNKVGPLGRVLFFSGQLPLIPAEMIDHEAPRPEAPPRGATVAYGEYLAHGCIGCHGTGFSGGTIPGVPPDWPEASNLTPNEETGIGSWSRDDFFRAMREGKRPDGAELRAEYMPWPNMARFGDDELQALWMYLESLQPRPHGGR